MLALVTCNAARDLDTDLPLLLGELPDAEVAAWDDPAVDWSRYDVAVIRSTWNYHERRDDFLAWVRATAALTSLWNRPETIEWNTDKRYLAELAAQGVPTVPTVFAAPGGVAEVPHLDGDVVVKPSVGAGSNGVRRFVDDPSGVADHVGELHRAGLTAMIQPYITAVDDCGETGLVYVGGEFSHGFAKGAILSSPIDWEGGLYAVERVSPRQPDPAELAVGDRVLTLLGPTAYARIDLLPTPEGPVVLEAELTEPSLFLHLDEGAAARAAAAFRSLDA